MKFVCDNLINYTGEKPSTVMLLKKRIRRYFNTFVEKDEHFRLFNNVKIIPVDKLDIFCLQLVGHLNSLDYFVKYPELQKALNNLSRFAIRNNSENVLEGMRTEGIVHFIKRIQK